MTPVPRPAQTRVRTPVAAGRAYGTSPWRPWTVATAAKAHRKIASATAQRTRALADPETWSSDPATAKLLSPDYTIDAAGARAAAWPEL
ncbi:hypothetical protein [Cryobacterium sp. PAMC25264]|uniref:hypothetical protein n=1 Tax=Cryobacterium sp. PAMC25264 TaxID=2861288 RepID=UPI001C624F60|nr:hypothetical protein [Cryobacterium sp. PAMC25264]QYF74617.1 hypothetical protein KY500_05400 [Cryobacterium sp. PAMC25264]